MDYQGKDFLLTNSLAKELYHSHAEKMPIFDFHCHLPIQDIAEDKSFRSLTECWLGKDGFGDHYKWRLMREFGIEEEFITGKASDHDKFLKYAEMMPYLAGNPIYEWTHLELKHFFGISKLLSPETAEEIYAEANEKLKTLTARKMMEISNVDTVYTTDDPLDDLHYHQALAKEKDFSIVVRPCFRPDKALHLERAGFEQYLEKLEAVCGKAATDLEALVILLSERLDYFIKNGCHASDHDLGPVHYRRASYEEANAAYLKARQGAPLTEEDIDAYQGYLLLQLGRRYHAAGMVQQYHIGAVRNSSERAFKALGPDTGYDVAGDDLIEKNLQALLSDLDMSEELPKTVLYSLNAKDYIVLATLMNAFQGGCRGKMQLGTAWWFNDHYDGMLEQFKVLSEDGILACFIGMLTDSRSFLSYPRHDYFRRELCAYLSDLVMKGRYPNDPAMLGKIVEDISFNNAKAYFGEKK